MEILSANRFANIKVPELLDYVTLQFNLEREEFEQANKAFFARVVAPANQALEKAGITIDDVDEIELLGGGVRVPMVTETLQAALGKEPSVHLNGDEAMCFGAAFIASNSSADFKVKQIFLTQHPQHDVTVRISPLKPEEATSREDQLAEGIEEADLIKYEQEFKLFNGSDYVGKSKALNINYNRDMKIELLKHEGDQLELLDAFLLKGVKTSLESEIQHLKDEQERARKKREKEKERAKAKSNETTSDEAKKEEKEPKESEAEEQGPIPTPKIKISVEYSRSGYMQVTKAMAGSYKIDVEQVRKESQLSRDQIKLAQQRLRWHKNRDENKIKTDSARNSYETLIYKLREWLREDDNAPYVKEDERESMIEHLSEREDWLYEEGAQQNHTTYDNLAKNLSAVLDKYQSRQAEHEKRDKVNSIVAEAMQEYDKKLEDLKDTKPWVTEQERQDVKDKMNEIQAWLQKQMAEQEKRQLFEDPVFKSGDVVKKMANLKKVYTTVSNKKKPKPEKKAKEDAKDDEEKATEEEPKKEEQEQGQGAEGEQKSEQQEDL